jgi:hypothetical protein
MLRDQNSGSRQIRFERGSEPGRCRIVALFLDCFDRRTIFLEFCSALRLIARLVALRARNRSLQPDVRPQRIDGARNLGGGIKALLRRPALPVLTARPNEAAGVVHLMPPRGRKKGPAAAAVKTRYRPLAAKGGVVFHDGDNLLVFGGGRGNPD